MSNFFNSLFIAAATLESIAFVLAALLALLALAWGKNGLKKLKKNAEARLWRFTGWLIVTKLVLMAITLLIQLFNYIRR